MDNKFIHLNKDNLLRLGIKDENGKDTGEYLEFDLEDIELPLKYQDLLEQEKKNRQNLKNQIMIIEKRQDVKGKKLMSKNEEDKIKAINEFYKKEVDVLNGFLGDRGVEKLLNGRKIGWTALQEIDELVEKQIRPYLKDNMINIEEKIKNKYGTIKDTNTINGDEVDE